MKVAICKDCKKPILYGKVDEKIVPVCPQGGADIGIEFIEFTEVFDEHCTKQGKFYSTIKEKYKWI